MPIYIPVDAPVIPVDEAEQTLAATGATEHTLATGDGTVWNLSGDYNGAVLTVGRRGYDSPSYQAYVSDSPGFDGEQFETARALPRDLIVPIYLRADSRSEFLDKKRRLLSGLSPKRGLATLSVRESDGSRRSISVYYTGRGGEGNTSRDSEGRNWVRLTLEFRAPQPYWRGDPQRLEFKAAAAGNFFPFLPLTVSSAQGLGTSTITIPGDTDAFPVWTINGPTSGGIELSMNPLVGDDRVLLLDSVLAEGEWIRINTHPTQLTVRDNLGANRWGDLQAGAALWPFPPGQVEVTVTAGGVSAASSIVLEIEPLYETA